MKSHYRYLCATITLEPAKAGKTIFFFVSHIFLTADNTTKRLKILVEFFFIIQNYSSMTTHLKERSTVNL